MSTGRLPSTDGGIQPTVVDAKGDLLVGVAADSISRLAVGSNDQVLTADSTTATGLKWAAAASGGANWTLKNTGGTALTGAQTVTVSGISGADKIMVLFGAASSANAGSLISIRFNTDTANNYYAFGPIINANSTYNAQLILQAINGSAQDRLRIAVLGASNTSDEAAGYCLITGCNSSGAKVFNAGGGVNIISGSPGQYGYITGGYYNSSSTISSISIHSSDGNLDAGTVYVYTSA